MKKFAFLSMALLFCLSVIQGQTKEQTKKSERVALKKLEGTIVADQSKRAFNADFSGATNVQSKRVDTYDEFTFTSKDGKQMKAFYDYQSKLVGTTQKKTYADLPVKAQEQIKKEYKDYTVDQVVFFDDNEYNPTDMILYGAQFDDEDSYMVELVKGSKKVVVQVSMLGNVSFFKELSK